MRFHLRPLDMVELLAPRPERRFAWLPVLLDDDPEHGAAYVWLEWLNVSIDRVHFKGRNGGITVGSVTLPIAKVVQDLDAEVSADITITTKDGAAFRRFDAPVRRRRVRL